MLVVTAFYPGDADQALRLATWAKELGGCKGHDLLLVKDTTCDPVIAEQIRSLFAECFDTVEVLEFVDHFKKWPESPNAIFGMVARHIRQNPRPWLFCEPDCVPLKAGWLDLLWAEYQAALAASKVFLGDFVSVHTPELDVPDHCSGNAIYPGDMMKHAGVALIASDIAWDVLAANEILPQMHRSKLLHHSWKHDAFADWEQFEREVLAFKPECCLFHADKSGSLYPLLRERRNLPVPQIPAQSIEAVRPETVSASDEPHSNCIPGSDGGQLICDIFIKTYPPDYPWLEYCLRSIRKFATGFQFTVVLKPDGECINGSWFGSLHVRIHVPPEYGADGYLSQQVFKLYADEFTDATHILFLDSDTIFTRPVTPQTYFKDGKVIWMMTPWEKTNTPWRPIVEKFMGQPVEFEFMRRHPTVVPRWLLAAVREFCLKQHGMQLDQYVMSQPHRAFSEFNVLGAFAYAFHRDQFHWVNTEEVPPDEWPELTVRQEHSWGGLHQDIIDQFEVILRKEGDHNDGRQIPRGMLCASGDGSTRDDSGRSGNDKETTGATACGHDERAGSDGEQSRSGASDRARSESWTTVTTTAPTFKPDSAIVPWESKEQSLEEIRSLAERLKNFGDNAAHVRAVRLELHNAGIIALPYRYKRRKGKWRSKKK